MISHPLPVRTERVDWLKVRVYDHRDAVGNAAGSDVAARIRELLSKQERVRMIFASAPSQNEFLQRLVREEKIDWSRITVFHMDEYIGLPKDAPQRFSRYLMEHLISRVNPGEVHLIDSTRPMEQECRRYGNLIQRAPIDIVCLGIGENGHLAFNDPPFADFEDPEVMKPVELDEVCRLQQVHDGCFFGHKRRADPCAHVDDPGTTVGEIPVLHRTGKSEEGSGSFRSLRADFHGMSGFDIAPASRLHPVLGSGCLGGEGGSWVNGWAFIIVPESRFALRSATAGSNASKNCPVWIGENCPGSPPGW